MKRKIYIMIFVFITLTLLVWALAQFYRSIYAGEWKQEAAVLQSVYEDLQIQADRIEPFFGEETIKIVHGTDKTGRKVIVWVSESNVHTEYADDGVDEQRIKELVLARQPDADILRVIPGKFGNYYVWEAFYKVRANKQEAHYYDYYLFTDGSFLETYRLSLTP